jgi:hypothetical protein
MATLDYLPDIALNTRARYSLDSVANALLVRGKWADYSNAYGVLHRPLTKQDCEANGVGYTFDTHAGGTCYFPCPDAYMIKDGDISRCAPRPVLTKAEIYYEILGQAVKDCAKLIPAYKDLVAEHGNDPTQVGFPADSGCINPFDPPNPPPAPTLPEEYVPSQQGGLPNPMGSDENTTSSGIFDNNASNGDPTKPKDAPPMSDPNGSSGQAGGQNGGVPNIPTIPDGTKQEVYVPPIPQANKIIDDKDPSGISKVLPRDRLLITDEEIDQLPKVNDFGVMTDGALALQLRAHPTFLDVNPSYLLEFQRALPNFQWEVTITPEEYALLSEDDQCGICGEGYNSIYTNPDSIARLRIRAPTITITRNAPSLTPPDFKECPLTKKQTACAQQVENGGNCSWMGGCGGYCKCPQADNTIHNLPPDQDSSSWMLIGGGILLLGGAYYIYSS